MGLNLSVCISYNIYVFKHFEEVLIFQFLTLIILKLAGWLGIG